MRRRVHGPCSSTVKSPSWSVPLVGHRHGQRAAEELRGGVEVGDQVFDQGQRRQVGLHARGQRQRILPVGVTAGLSQLDHDAMALLRVKERLFPGRAVELFVDDVVARRVGLGHGGPDVGNLERQVMRTGAVAVQEAADEVGALAG